MSLGSLSLSSRSRVSRSSCIKSSWDLRVASLRRPTHSSSAATKRVTPDARCTDFPSGLHNIVVWPNFNNATDGTTRISIKRQSIIAKKILPVCFRHMCTAYLAAPLTAQHALTEMARSFGSDCTKHPIARQTVSRYAGSRLSSLRAFQPWYRRPFPARSGG